MTEGRSGRHDSHAVHRACGGGYLRAMRKRQVRLRGKVPGACIGDELSDQRGTDTLFTKLGLEKYLLKPIVAFPLF